MWLAAGSLHTVVLCTPGKCAARWICLLMVNVLAESRSCRGVAVGGAAQAEQPPQRVRLVAGPGPGAPPQLGAQWGGGLGEFGRRRARAHPEPGQPGTLPLLQQVGQADGGAGKD